MALSFVLACMHITAVFAKTTPGQSSVQGSRFLQPRPIFSIGVLGPMAYDDGKYYLNAWAAMTANMDFESDDPPLKCKECNKRFGIRLIFGDDDGSAEGARIGALRLMLGNQLTMLDFEPVVGLIGGQLSETCASSVQIGHVFKVPQVSWGCPMDFGTPGQYPFFSRTQPMDYHLAIAAILEFFRWERLTLVAQSDDPLSAAGVEKLLGSTNHTEVKLADLDSFVTPQDWREVLQWAAQWMNSIWVVILSGPTSLQFVSILSDMEVVQPWMQWVFAYTSQSAIQERLHVGDHLLLGALLVRPNAISKAMFDDFFLRLQQHGLHSYRNSATSRGLDFDLFDYAVQALGEQRVIGMLGGEPKYRGNWHSDDSWPMIYDAFYTFVHAIDSLLTNVSVADITGPGGGELLRHAVAAVKFTGLSGNVSFMKNGKRPGDWDIINFKAQEMSASRGPQKTWDACLVGTYYSGSREHKALLTFRDRLGGASNVTFMDGSSWSSRYNLSSVPLDRLPQCPVGEIRDIRGQCNKCPVGKFADPVVWSSTEDPKRETCTACAAGKYAGLAGLSECSLCPAGSDTRHFDKDEDEDDEKQTDGDPEIEWRRVSSRDEHVSEQGVRQEAEQGARLLQEEQGAGKGAGKGAGQGAGPETGPRSGPEAASLAGQAAPNQPPNQTVTGQPSSCIECDAGTYSREGEMCQPCEEGRYTESPGSVACKFAPLGTYVNATGATEPMACPWGLVTLRPGERECGPCLAGQIPNGTVGCAPCPIGFFSNDAGSTACISCETVVGLWRTTDFRGAISPDECACPEGFYAIPGIGACKKCETGMRCAFGSDLDHYWQEAAALEGNPEALGFCGGDRATHTKPYPCLQPGYFASPDRPTYVYLCQSTEACPGNMPAGVLPCKSGFEGVNCGRCATGLYKSGNECKSCQGADIAMAPIAVVVAMVVAGVLHWAWNRKTAHVESVESVLASVTFGTTIAFMQTLGIFSRLALGWPSDFRVLLDFMSFFVFDFQLLRFSCVFKESLTNNFLSSMLTPIMVVVCFGSWYFLSRLVHIVFGEKFEAFSWSSIFNSIGLVISSLFISIASTTASFFDCYASPNGQETLRAYPFEVCGSAEYEATYPWAMFGVLVYLVGLSSGMAFLLWIAPRLYHIETFRTGVRFLVFKFRPSIWYWNLVLLVRSLLIAMVSIMEPNDAWIQFLIMLILLIAGLLLHLLFQPYLDRYANILETTELSFLIIIMAMGSWFLNGGHEEHPDKSKVISALLITSVILCFLVLFSVFCWALFLAAFPAKADARACKRIEKGLPKLRCCYEIVAELPDDQLESFLAKLAYNDRQILFDAAHLTATQFCGYQGQGMSEQSLLPDQDRFTTLNSGKFDMMEHASHFIRSIQIEEMKFTKSKGSSDSSRSVSAGAFPAFNSGKKQLAVPTTIGAEMVLEATDEVEATSDPLYEYVAERVSPSSDGNLAVREDTGSTSVRFLLDDETRSKTSVRSIANSSLSTGTSVRSVLDEETRSRTRVISRAHSCQSTGASVLLDPGEETRSRTTARAGVSSCQSTTSKGGTFFDLKEKRISLPTMVRAEMATEKTDESEALSDAIGKHATKANHSELDRTTI